MSVSNREEEIFSLIEILFTVAIIYTYIYTHRLVVTGKTNRTRKNDKGLLLNAVSSRGSSSKLLNVIDHPSNPPFLCGYCVIRVHKPK